MSAPRLPVSAASFFAEIEHRRRRFESEIRHGVVQPPRYGSAFLQPDAAVAYLLRCHELVCSILVAEAPQFSAAQWLWYLRRFPIEVLWARQDPAERDFIELNMAEVVTGLGGTDVSKPGAYQGRGNYAVDAQTVSAVTQFMAGFPYLRHIEWLLRSAARETRMSFSTESQLPREFPQPGQREASRRYFDRLRRYGGRFASRAGVRLGHVVPQPVPPLTLLTVNRCEVQTVSTKWDPGPEQRVEEIPASFLPTLMNYDRLSDFAAAIPPNHPEWPTAAFCECAILLRVGIGLVEYPPAHRGMLISGCMSYDADFISEQFDPLLGEALHAVSLALPQADLPHTVGELLQVLAIRRGEMRPLRGGQIARLDGELILIDLHAATAQLEYGLDIAHMDGAVANVRADLFERQIQEVIDNSGWRAPVQIRALVGRELRQGGQAITDIDAVGSKERTLLLISAKSRVFTTNLERGEYQSVRNAKTMVEDACRRAADHRAALRARRRGDNYDFGDYDEIKVVVCTPYPVFVPLGTVTQEILPGLPAAVCLDELEEWLFGEQQGGPWTGPASTP